MESIYEQVTEAINHLSGINSDNLEVWQIMIWAFIMYMVGLLMIRSGAKRFLGKNTAFDVILGIIFGSVISRAINSDASFWGTIMAGAVLVGLHWLFGYLAFKLDDFGNFVKGNKRILVKDGEILWDAMEKSSISKKDLMRAICSNGNTSDISKIQLATLERSGEISIVKKAKEPRVLELDVKDGVQMIRITFD